MRKPLTVQASSNHKIFMSFHRFSCFVIRVKYQQVVKANRDAEPVGGVNVVMEPIKSLRYKNTVITGRGSRGCAN